MSKPRYVAILTSEERRWLNEPLEEWAMEFEHGIQGASSVAISVVKAVLAGDFGTAGNADGLYWVDTRPRTGRKP